MSEITQSDVLHVLSWHIGEDEGIGIRELARQVAGPNATARDERTIRAAITELRRAGFHICAHPATGYHMAASDTELVRTCDFLYDRAMTSLEQIAAMRRVSLPDLRGQLHLPT
jgi:hypothetical protein